MKQQNKKILLVAFAYPPFKSIGSRRWAKFSKYLAQKGYEIFVIASENPHDKEGNWLQDVVHNKIHRYYLKYNYPSALKTGNKSFWRRVYRRVYYFFLGLKLKGNLSDEAILWEEIFERQAIELIRQFEIETVISTSPPFRLSYYVSLLKQKFPKLKIIADFRDVWLDGRVYGKSGFSQPVLKYEERLEKHVLETVDYITLTDRVILDRAIRQNPEIDRSKFIFLPHAYDEDDYRGIDIKEERHDGKIVFVFGGTLTTPSIEEAAVPLWEALCVLKSEKREIYDRLKFIFYHQNIFFNKRLKDFSLEDIFESRNPVSEEEFFQELATADYPVSILPDFLKDYITTKNISYLPFRKPIVIIANEGQATKMVIEKRVGYVLRPGNCYSDLLHLVAEHDSKSPNFNRQYDVFQHSYSCVTDILEQLIQNK